MLKFLRLGAVLAAISISFTSLPVNAAPDNQAKEIYMGVVDQGSTYVKSVYLIPSAIRLRGDLRRYQTHDIYGQQQDSGLGYKYTQVIRYHSANCREGSTGVQKAVFFDRQKRQVNESVGALQLEVPDPGSAKEKTLDFVCDYKN